jgi:hypothetical protein
MLGVMLLLLLLRREWKSFVCVYCLFDVSCFFCLFHILHFFLLILTINTLSSLVEVVLFRKRTAFCFLACSCLNVTLYLLKN